MTMKNLGCFLVFLFIVMVVPLDASDVTLYGGFQHQGELTLNTTLRTQLGRTVIQTFDPKNFGVFGFRYSHGTVFGSEHTLAYAPNFVESQTKAIIYNSNLIVHVPLPKVRPYGTAGLGSVFSWGSSLVDIGNKFAVNYGGGLKLTPAGPVGGRIDIRGYTIPKIQGQTLNVLEVSIGVLFSF